MDTDLSPSAGNGVEGAVLAAVAASPRTAWEIVRALEADDPGGLEGREGELHPLLADLVRRGAIEARWSEDAAGRPRREYAIPGAPAPAAPAPAGPAAAAGDPLLARLAGDAARSVPGAFEREAARAEMLAHLEASAAAWARLGIPPAEAARRAAADFGDPWRIRTDLGRVHRGRRVVLFPATFGARLHALVIHELPALAVLLAVVLLLRWQVVQAYNIPTGSMEPTLHGDEEDGDLILVDKTAFLRRDPRRWDIIVFFPPPGAEVRPDGASPTAFVKRCAGLGGEEIDILGGDLYVDGLLARRSPDVEEAMMVLLYDQAADLAGAARRTRLGSPVADQVLDVSWREVTPRTWAIPDGGRTFRATPGEEGEARLRYAKDIQNSMPFSLAHQRTWYSDVGDAEVRFVARPGTAAAVVGADLVEGDERHSVRIGSAGVLLRSGGITRAFPGARAAPGREVEVRFRNVDDRLTAWIDGEMVLREDLPPRVSRPEESPSAGVELVAEGGPASFEGVRIRRDVQYLRDGKEWPKRIPEGHVFMMGDNTGSSRDSRAWGPVPHKDLIGVPFWVVYPPTRAKALW